MKVLFINFADDGGIAETSIARLTKKYGPDNVILAQAINAKEGSILSIDEIWGNIPESLESYAQIIISAHGEIDDTQHCYYRPASKVGLPITKLVNHTELANFCSEFFIKTKLIEAYNPDLHITFSICYGARTVDYTVDHIAEAANINFRESFVGYFLT